MKVLVSDNLGEAGIRMFQEEDGIDVDVKTGLPPEELKKIIGNYDALVIRSATKVTENLLEAATRLKVIGRAGIGLDNVDIPAATKRGIIVMNTPGGNVITTAEHAIAMILTLSRNIPQGTATLKKGLWEKKKLQGREIYNKILGVIGFGKIGSIVADRARGLKMQVIVHDPYVRPEQIEKEGFESVSLEELYRRSDYITIHVPKLKDTTNLLNKDVFNKMKAGVMIVNCARGGIVNEDDLLEALESGKVAGAALDVFEKEPPGVCRLIEHEQLICTPHLGASTQEAQTKVAVDVASQIIDYLKNGTILNAVNFPSITGDLLKKLKPLLSLADQMGSLQAQLVQGPVEEVSIEYAGDFKGLDLSPVSIAVLRGLLAPVVKDDVNFVNAQVLAKERGIKVKETTSDDSEEYINLVTIRVVTSEMTNTVSGTIFGKNQTRIVKINNFRLELIPQGHLALIYNLDKPGAIGSFAMLLGDHKINIDQMQVGQEETGKMNIIFLRTNVPISEHVIEKLLELPLIISVTPLEFET
ncbi:MAG: phosphoglycerate dehydrogenase [Pseudomonadota bacterium]|uniref:D-3-phosphoglycerate dehydrogenase n=1 Tax=Candidatus Desulfatibia profunda TaxID=2841695 RepID=A0A8J6NJV8_9BACT|nr:phosphoglycerate dehydrogenase [Candidatus Desulfatibia profunda]MBL7180808.1 phosphoglycerate dehydrogenase [Desulfobacterales bacterium]